MDDLPCLFLAAGQYGEIPADIRTQIQRSIRERSRAADSGHNSTWCAVHAHAASFHRTDALIDILPAVDHQHTKVGICQFVCCEHASRTCADDHYVIVIGHHISCWQEDIYL